MDQYGRFYTSYFKALKLKGPTWFSYEDISLRFMRDNKLNPVIAMNLTDDLYFYLMSGVDMIPGIILDERRSMVLVEPDGLDLSFEDPDWQNPDPDYDPDSESEQGN